MNVLNAILFLVKKCLNYVYFITIFKNVNERPTKGFFCLFFFLEKAIILARQYPKENTRKYVKI